MTMIDMLDDTVEDKKNEKFPAYYKFVTNIDLVGKIVNNIENDTLPVDNFEDIDNFTISLPQYITGQKYPPPRPKHQIIPDNFTQEKLSEISKIHYPEIKLVVMSATLNTEKFHSYFIKYGYTPNIINIPGQAQKLTIQYASPSSSHQNNNDEDSSTNEQEDILIFLPGMDEINMREEHIKAHKLSKNYSLEIRRLHRKLCNGRKDVNEITSIFKNRLIYLSTNIAETSITLPNLKFVIDSGYEKSIKYIPEIDAISVQLNMITQSSANQRAGRASRVSDGLVYRAYTEERYNAMCEHKIPGNQSLLSYCLKVMDFTKKPVNFISNLINPPNANEIYMAIKQLHLLRAVNYTESDQEPTLTRLGRKIIDINAEVPVVISLIYGIAFKCIDPVMYILSAQNDSCIYQETGRSKESRKIETSKQIAGFLNNKNGKGESDHFIDLTIFQHCLKYNIAKVHEQMQINSDLLNKNRSFYDDLKKFLKFHFSNVIDKDINKNANNPDLIRFCIAAGLRHKIAYRDENDGKWFDYKTNQKLKINLKSSVQENTEIPTSKIYEVTIAIHDIWHMGEKPLNAEFKDIIRDIFSEFEIIHTYVQTLEPHQGYIVVPSTTNVNKIFELDTLPGKNENKLTLGFGYCRNVNFMNSQNPKFWNEQLFARHYPEISLPTK
ncbi:pre-mRNA-splicing factor ATP-dependent RNA helicase DEAH1-like [Contarinia nasturtii]|uniref:pre-mRNA-splicing factor ATP-dependent RNA helicase DEAH1-like n=1 Tax=Contarinia nasturtii TaxID=265458 RepID=UPI0012D45F53|nr:pre-mRNA-splicing factor ATP-dependent RNA helicase DEAH1-like [Contarinia nasturtii]